MVGEHPRPGEDGRGSPVWMRPGLKQPGARAWMPRAPSGGGRGTLPGASRGSTSLGHLMGGFWLQNWGN